MKIVRKVQIFTFIIVLLFPILFSFAYVFKYGVNVVHWDQWETVVILEKIINGTFKISDLFLPHNEHIIFFPHLLVLLLAYITKYNNIFEMYVVLIILLACFLLFFLYFKKKYKGAISLFWFLPLPFLIFNLRQYENILWGWQIIYLFPLLFGLISFYLIEKSGQALIAKNSNINFIIALLCGTVASYSSAMGVLVWPAGLVQISILKFTNKIKKILFLVIWTITGIFEIFIYYLLLQRNSDPYANEFSFKVVINALLNIFLTLKNIFVLIGRSIFSDRNILSLSTGIFIFVLLIISIIVLKKIKRINENSFLLAVATYSIFTVLMIIILGGRDAIASRYSSYTIYLIISLYLIFVDFFVLKKLYFIKILGFIFLGLVLFSLPFSYINGVALARNDRIKKLENAFILLTYDTEPSYAFKRLYPWDGKIEKYAPVLKKLKYNVFSENLIRVDNNDAVTFKDLEPLMNIDEISFKYFSEGELRSYYSVANYKEKNSLTIPYREEVFMQISGWAVDENNSQTASFINLRIDNKNYPVYYGIERKDIEKKYNNKLYRYCGFNRLISLNEIGTGNHDILLNIFSSDVNFYYKNDILKLYLLDPEKKENIKNSDFKIEDNSRYKINMDIYEPNEIISGDKILVGWVIDQKIKELNDLTLLIYDGEDINDSGFLGVADYFIKRDDVANFFRTNEYEFSGFYFLLDTTKLQNGSHDICIYALNKDGTYSKQRYEYNVKN